MKIKSPALEGDTFRKAEEEKNRMRKNRNEKKETSWTEKRKDDRKQRRPDGKPIQNKY